MPIRYHLKSVPQSIALIEKVINLAFLENYLLKDIVRGFQKGTILYG